MATMPGGDAGSDDPTQREVDQHWEESSLDTPPDNLLDVSDSRVTDEEHSEGLVEVPETGTVKKRQ